MRKKWIFPSLKIDGRAIFSQVAQMRDCGHPRKAPHVAIQCDGKPFYRMQCPDCGKKLSNQLPHSSVPNRDKWPQWNEELFRQHSLGSGSAYEQNRAAAIAARKAEWRAVYNQYLASDDWKSVRERVLKRACGVCEGCLEAQAKEVHHQTYAHVGDEFLFELVAICGPCHNRMHPRSSNGYSELVERHLEHVQIYG